MRITGTIPEHIRRLMPREERTTRETMTLPDIEEQVRVNSEKALQRQIADWLRMKGVPVGNPRMDRKTTLAVGWPDFVFPWAPWRGKFVALEAKTENGKQSEEQKRFERLIIECEGCYYVVRSLADVVSALSKVEP